MSDFLFVECYPHCGCEIPSPSLFYQTTTFWSSISYFISALLLYVRVPKSTFKFELWTFASIILAISSFLFHSTFTRMAVAFDYASIGMIFLFFVIFKSLEKWKAPRNSFEIIFFGGYLLLLVLFYQVSMWSRIGVSLTLFILGTMEIAREVKNFNQPLMRIWSPVALGVVSFMFFLLEETKLWCHPENLIPAHALWHGGSAISLYFYGRLRFLSPKVPGF